MNLQDKQVVLTGATGGIGAATANRLAAEGAHLLLTGRNEDKLRTMVGELTGSGHDYLVADLTQAEGRKALYLKACEFGVDLLINNAGANELALLTNLDDQLVADIVQLNLTVPMLICRDFIPLLKVGNESTIVNVGSILGSIGYAGSTVYCATKFGVRGFTESLRRELADTPINVVYFAPRATDTSLNSDAMQKMNQALGAKVDSPAEVADHLLKALKEQTGKNYYLGWPESLFVRINSLLPSLVDKSLLKQLATIQKFASHQK